MRGSRRNQKDPFSLAIKSTGGVRRPFTIK
jgi:hypothetical protein